MPVKNLRFLLKTYLRNKIPNSDFSKRFFLNKTK